MIQIDMKKPDHCLRCPMRNSNNECVLIKEIDTSWDWKEMYANCPLQEIETKRKKGKWILIDTGFYVYAKCSQCGETLNWRRNFCPHCGADMREGGENEAN